MTSRVHQNRLLQLAREGARMMAQRLGEFDAARRDATLVAFLLANAEDLVDQALDMRDKLLGQQFKKGERKQVSTSATFGSSWFLGSDPMKG